MGQLMGGARNSCGIKSEEKPPRAPTSGLLMLKRLRAKNIPQKLWQSHNDATADDHVSRLFDMGFILQAFAVI